MTGHFSVDEKQVRRKGEKKMAKMIKCKTCGADIASNAKACPQCGAKNKKPIYKRWWFYVLVLLVVVIIAGGSSKTPTSSDGKETTAQTDSAKTKATAEPISYTHYDVVELFSALKENALKAKDTYNKQYVEIEGYLKNIDSDGKYISVGASDKNLDFMFDTVHCTIKSDEQKNQIMELKTDDPIVVRGIITDVGEVLGYYLDIDSIG